MVLVRDGIFTTNSETGITAERPLPGSGPTVRTLMTKRKSRKEGPTVKRERKEGGLPRLRAHCSDINDTKRRILTNSETGKKEERGLSAQQ